MKKIKLSTFRDYINNQSIKWIQVFIQKGYFVYKLKEIFDETTEIEINEYIQFLC